MNSTRKSFLSCFLGGLVRRILGQRGNLRAGESFSGQEAYGRLHALFIVWRRRSDPQQGHHFLAGAIGRECGNKAGDSHKGNRKGRFVGFLPSFPAYRTSKFCQLACSTVTSTRPEVLGAEPRAPEAGRRIKRHGRVLKEAVFGSWNR